MTSESVIERPQDGKNLSLSIDARIQEKMYEEIYKLAHRVGFQGGAGVIMNIHDGTLLAATSYPEYSSAVMSKGEDTKQISSLLSDKQNPFLNRVTLGLYTPGSIVKPFVAMGALAEGIISPSKQILSTGSISLPNPFFPGKFSVFRDWKAHGWVDMRKALAVSSDVYFYAVGGGFEDQQGLGISNIEKYMRIFGFGKSTGIDIGNEAVGTIPNPEWKKENFDGDIWRIGDTYNTSIGQYGFQVTPIQAVKATASLANEGMLIEPSIILDRQNIQKGEVLPFENNSWFKIINEGMRQTVLEGTARGLNIAGLEVAGKTGTAELGALKQFVNSWVIGFFPYKDPQYAFVIMMEKGPHDNLIGATYVGNQVLNWMVAHTPEYTK